MSTSADEPAQERHPARPWARSRRCPGDDGFGAVEDVLVDRVVDRPDHELIRDENAGLAGAFPLSGTFASPLTDSNRRPPTYRALSAATGHNRCGARRRKRPVKPCRVFGTRKMPVRPTRT